MNAIEMNRSVTQEQQSEAIDWTSDCMGLTGDQKVGAGFAYVYVTQNYPGGWDAFVAECCTSAQSYTLTAGERVRITRYRPDGKVHFVKVGEIKEWWGYGGRFIEDERPNVRIVASNEELAKVQRGWRQTIEKMAN